MKLLTEATLDDQFNQQMAKIQDAIAKLEALSKKFAEGDVRPVESQFRALQRASTDLDSVARDMFGMDRYKELMR